MKFPKEFLLGASTAAHQVEGNNRYSDLWAQEQMEHSSFAEPSNDAVDHYHRYEEDIALMAGAGLNAYRFSIEWARVEPQEGCFDESELEHYRKVIRCCREHGVEPVVTLHHFSSPKWLIEHGGWEAESTVDYFKRYAVKVVEALGDELHYICTINEANMGLQIAAISKRYMMQMQKAAAARAAARAGRKQRADGYEFAEDAGKPQGSRRGISGAFRYREPADLPDAAHAGGRFAHYARPRRGAGCHQGDLPRIEGRSDPEPARFTAGAGL